MPHNQYNQCNLNHTHTHYLPKTQKEVCNDLLIYIHIVAESLHLIEMYCLARTTAQELWITFVNFPWQEEVK